MRMQSDSFEIRNSEYEKLLTEAEAIDALGLGDRPNPPAALRWLVRVHKLPVVRLGRGILRFKPDDIASFIDRRRR